MLLLSHNVPPKTWVQLEKGSSVSPPPVVVAAPQTDNIRQVCNGDRGVNTEQRRCLLQ